MGLYIFRLVLRSITIILALLFGMTICYAQDARTVATEIVKEQLKLDSTTIENADVTKILDDKIQAQIDEAIERIRRQKIDAAKNPVPAMEIHRALTEAGQISKIKILAKHPSRSSASTCRARSLMAMGIDSSRPRVNVPQNREVA